MARARNIKPGFFLNEYLGTCDPLEALLFEGLWLLADRDGRLEFRPLRIKAQIFPYRDLSAQVITGFVRNLSSNGFIVLYEVDGNQYIEVCGFLEHQNPHKNEKPSEIPPPPSKTTGCKESSNYSTSTDIIGTAPADSLNPSLLNPSSLNPESSGAKKSAPSARGTRLPADWQLTDELKAIAKQIRPEWPDNHVQRVADGFKDYWLAKSGKDATKADWVATWRNWCRNDKSTVWPSQQAAATSAPTRASHKPMPTLPPRKPRPEGLDLG